MSDNDFDRLERRIIDAGQEVKELHRDFLDFKREVLGELRAIKLQVEHEEYRAMNQRMTDKLFALPFMFVLLGFAIILSPIIAGLFRSRRQ